jgi:hypothetical protein
VGDNPTTSEIQDIFTEAIHGITFHRTEDGRLMSTYTGKDRDLGDLLVAHYSNTLLPILGSLPYLNIATATAVASPRPVSKTKFDYLLFTAMGLRELLRHCWHPLHQHRWNDGGLVGWAKVVPCPSWAVITTRAGRGCRGVDIPANNLGRGSSTNGGHAPRFVHPTGVVLHQSLPIAHSSMAEKGW